MASLAGQGESTRRVAVVGGGISGLFCASTLAQFGYNVSLFDMGKSAPGESSWLWLWLANPKSGSYARFAALLLQSSTACKHSMIQLHATTDQSDQLPPFLRHQTPQAAA